MKRIIKQLHEVGIQEIYVVVGFMKEKYEYLMDVYSVELVVNPDYATKNNLHSLRLVKEHLENAYIIPCDIWCDRNPFHRHELYSWYMVSDLVENESNVRVNRKMVLVNCTGKRRWQCDDRYQLPYKRGRRYGFLHVPRSSAKNHSMMVRFGKKHSIIRIA